MKKILAAILALVMCFGLVACGGAEEAAPAEKNDAPAVEQKTEEVKEEAPAATAREKRACLISDSSMAGDFDQVIARGFTFLEEEGWETKIIEALDKAEYEEDIYAMAEEGYELIFLKGDAIATVVIDIAEEFHEEYPDVYFIMVDSYLEHDLDFATAVPVDPYESSFIGGFIAANMSTNNEVAWIGHIDTINLARFREGFTAGAKYANPDTKVVISFTGDWGDPIKGQEAVVTVHDQNPNVDVIAHAAYISGNGVLTKCEELGIPVIGCDTWQGEKSTTCFWSTLKSCDLMIRDVANRWLNGEEGEFGLRMSYNIAAGSIPYDDRDYEKLPDELKGKLDELMEGIKTGSVDIFYGEYAEYILGY